MSALRKPLTWPPRIGTRICLDTGYAHSSWSGEVRAVVDEDFAVIKRWRKHKGRHTYEVLDRLTVETFNRDGVRFFDGGLRRSTVEARS